jgi:hypothetical protein
LISNSKPKYLYHKFFREESPIDVFPADIKEYRRHMYTESAIPKALGGKKFMRAEMTEFLTL